MTNLKTFFAAFAVGGAVLFAADIALACETVAVEGSNYTVKADPTCVFAAESVQDDTTKDWSDLDFLANK